MRRLLLLLPAVLVLSGVSPVSAETGAQATLTLLQQSAWNGPGHPLDLRLRVGNAGDTVLAGLSIMVIGSIIAGIPNPLDPMRLFRLTVVISVTSFALISMMFLLMVRVTDPLMPRMMFGVLNTLLYFPSGAVYPQQGFPNWMQWIAVVDPFTYAVHAFKSLLLKNTDFGAIGFDMLYLVVFSAVMMTGATLLFKRTL